MRALGAFALVLAAGCGQRMILETRIDRVVRDADNHVVVEATLSCDTLRSYPSCEAVGDYYVQARWESPTQGAPVDLVEQCHPNALNANGAEDKFVFRSTGAIPVNPQLRVRVTARLKNPTDAAYQIYDADPVPCP